MKVTVVGMGPSGMMAAIKASEKHEVTIIERNSIPGRKLFITGKGRCNVTSSLPIGDFFDYIPRNESFLYSAFYTFSNEDVREFFEKRGVKLKEERGNRVFPQSDKSSDIIKALTREIEKRGIEVRYDTCVRGIKTENGRVISLVTDKGPISGDYFIITGGGASYPITGSDGSMLSYLKKAGIKVNDFKPSLIPLTVRESVKGLAGVSLRNVSFTLSEGKKVLYKDQGEMLFTHNGVSGPIVLSSSCYYKDSSNLKCSIDLKPALDEKTLDLRILRDFEKYQNKDIANGLKDLLIGKLIPVVLERCEISQDKKIHDITKDERRKLLKTIKGLEYTVTGTRPIAEAIISRGGIDVSEIDPSTMKLLKFENLSCAGEIIDVDAVTGGFNLQIAFSTGYLAGGNI